MKSSNIKSAMVRLWRNLCRPDVRRTEATGPWQAENRKEPDDSTTLNKPNGRWRADAFGNGARARGIGQAHGELGFSGHCSVRCSGGRETYGYVSSEGTVPVTNIPTDPRFGEIIPKPRYHAAVSAQKREEAVNRYARKYRLSLRSCSP